MISGSVNTGALGVYTLEYLKVDGAGNSSGVTRSVTVEDTTAPVVTLIGNDPITLIVGNAYTESGATWDDLPTLNTGTIASPTSGVVDTNSTGTYLLTYEYVDIG